MALQLIINEQEAECLREMLKSAKIGLAFHIAMHAASHPHDALTSPCVVDTQTKEMSNTIASLERKLAL